MNSYSIQFYTEDQWAEQKVAAETPEEALAQGRAVVDGEDWRNLEFLNRDRDPLIGRIRVFDASGDPVAEWRHPQLRLQWAAADLLSALEQAVTALNTEPRFTVPSLASDSYRIAAICDLAIAKAKRPPG
jgi:hypothetical protein